MYVFNSNPEFIKTVATTSNPLFATAILSSFHGENQQKELLSEIKDGSVGKSSSLFVNTVMSKNKE